MIQAVRVEPSVAHAAERRVGVARAGRAVASRRGGASKVVVGCLVVLVLALGALVAGGFFVAQNWRGWMASAVEIGINETASQAGLAPSQLDEIKAQVGALMDDFRAGNVTLEQLGLVAEELTEGGDIIAMGVVQGVGTQYLGAVQLDEAAAASGRMAIQRFVQGLNDGSIESGALQSALAPLQDAAGQDVIRISVNDISMALKPPGRVTPEELQQVFTNLHEAATAAGVPTEVPPFDFAAHLREAIDRALGRAPEVAPDAAPASGTAEDAGSDGG